MRIYLLFLLILVSLAGYSQRFHISASNANHNTFPFSSKVLMSEYDSVPYYVARVPVSNEQSIFSPRLENIEIAQIDSSLIPANIRKKISNEFSIKTKNIIIRKNIETQADVRSLRKNTENGQYEQLLSFDIAGHEVKNREYTKGVRNRSYASNSVLSSGTWYKIATVNAGVHRITYENLSAWGIETSGINPANIRLFNNGSRMLPENNSEPIPDDLSETPLFMVDGNDGTFDPGDYFLFFTEGISYWDTDTATMRTYTNLYSDNNFCFLTFNNGAGIRITDIPTPTDNPTHFADRFFEIQSLKQNLYNLLKSGKNWYGDMFDNLNLTRNYSFAFSNICTDNEIKIVVDLAAQSSTNSTFNISTNQNSVSVDIIPVYGFTDAIAKIGRATLNYLPNTGNININISYNQKGNAEAIGWLDAINIQAWRYLVFSGSQMAFCNPKMNGVGNIAEYAIKNSNENLKVWDISNPLKPASISGDVNNGIYKFKIDNSYNHRFIAFNGTSFLTPSFVGRVENQNLHALPFVDLIIVYHPMFRSQASTIGQMHLDRDNISYTIVTPAEIYNEFSGGKQDPTAIRNFMKMFYDKASNPSEMPKHLLLFGNASYDYKSRIPKNSNLVPTFQSKNSLLSGNSYASDDFFGLLDNAEGEDCNGNIDISIGRFTVGNAEQADNVVNKILNYSKKSKIESSSQNNLSNFVSNIADWRNQICFIADDGNGNLHYNQADRIARHLDTTVKFLNIDKIYLDAFKQISTTGGEFSPDAKMAIQQKMQKGALIMNYIGHGGGDGWTEERILNLNDINEWTNKYNLPFFIAATCDFAHFDNPKDIFAGELVFLKQDGGGIGLLTSSRQALSGPNEAMNASFYKKAFTKDKGKYPTFGELVAFSKNDNGTNIAIRNFLHIGDPALSLAIPENIVITTEINNKNVSVFSDTISALKKVTIKGYVALPDSTKLTDFNGTIYPIVYDKKIKLQTLGSEIGDYVSTFELQKNIIFKGKASVINGDFSFTFIVPKDIKYNYGKGRISYYAENSISDATGWYDNFIIGGFADTLINDNRGPNIELFLNTEKFVNGGITDENPILLANLKDDSGINTIGTSFGHDITTTIDGNTKNEILLNEFYEAEKDSYMQGKIKYPFKSLAEGSHTLTLKAWDILNNSSEANIDFIVAKTSKMALKHVLNYPNPFSTNTTFMFEHNQINTSIDIQIQIFTISGKIVKTIKSKIFTDSNIADQISWDGRDDFGAELARGVYIYRIRAKNHQNKTAEKIEKLVIIK